MHTVRTYEYRYIVPSMSDTILMMIVKYSDDKLYCPAVNYCCYYVCLYVPDSTNIATLAF